MQNSELDKLDIDKELEFNNGIGDALKQKNDYVFNWKKTSVVLLFGMMSVVMVTFGVIEIGKNALDMNQSVISDDDLIKIQKMINETDTANWDVLPEDANIKITINDEKTTINNDSEKKYQFIDEAPLKQDAVPLKQAPLITHKKINPKEIKTRHSLSKNPSISSEKKSMSVASKKVIYRVIAGSFSKYNNAQVELQKVNAKGFDGYIWSLTSPEKKVSYKVQVGAFKSVKSAQVLVNQLEKKNIKSFIAKY